MKQTRFTKIVPMILAASCCLVGQGLRATAQDASDSRLPAQPSGRSGKSTLLPAAGEDYHIGPGDVIAVKIDKAEELSGNFRVSSSGTIPMYYLGELPVHQKTPEQLEREIADRLRGRYLREPHVTVTVAQYNSRTLFIQGAVHNPGVYQIEGKPSLLALITLAGGLDKDHGSTAFIIRPATTSRSDGNGASRPASGAQAAPNAGPEAGPEAPPARAPAARANVENGEDASQERGDYEMLQVNINGLFRGHFDQNVDIEPGDIVNIPASDVFFVAGEVHRPGSFPLKEGTTLRQGISLAEGTTFKALGRGMIFREDPSNGKRQEIPIDISAIMKGKAQDLPILANDVIVVPNSQAKSVASVLLSAFGSNAMRIPHSY